MRRRNAFKGIFAFNVEDFTLVRQPLASCAMSAETALLIAEKILSSKFVEDKDKKILKLVRIRKEAFNLPLHT
jgi:hypothetical protein